MCAFAYALYSFKIGVHKLVLFRWIMHFTILNEEFIKVCIYVLWWHFSNTETQTKTVTMTRFTLKLLSAPTFSIAAHFSDTLTISDAKKYVANIISTQLSLSMCIICMAFREICCHQYSNHYNSPFTCVRREPTTA